MKAGFWISASVIVLMGAPAVHAQTTTPAGAGSETITPKSDEIIVTAERRATNLQQTSVAATVLTGQDLTRKGVNAIDQLQFATPALTVNNTGQGNAVNIRGIGQTERGSAYQSGVVTYRDGVATFSGYFQSEPYYDITSAEVLRGPQGTFAGGNATGGAIFITEANPTLDKVGGYALAQYGNYNDMKFQGAINLPVSDTLALRFATSDERRDTFYHITGPWTGNPGNLRSYSGRVSLLWQPTSQLRVLIKGDYNNVEQGGYPADPANPAQRPAGTDLFHITSNAHLSGRDEFGRIVANISYTTDGGVVFRSISGFQKGTVQQSIDTDGTSTGLSTFYDKIHERIWSQEVNILSPSAGRFTWLLGGYYQNDKITIPEGGYNNYGPYSAALPIYVNTILQGTNPKTALAAFGQVGYQITPALQLTLGGRWSRTTARYDLAALIPQAAQSATQQQFDTDNQLNGKVALNWKLDRNNFLYAFAATGSKAGGLNTVTVESGTIAKPFKAETVNDYEMGWKATWLGGHLRTQLGGYYNHYKDFQIAITDPNNPGIGVISNAARPTEIYGAEFSAQGNVGHLQFDFATSVSHSKIGQFYAFDARVASNAGTCDPAGGPATATGCLSLGGRQASYAPKFTLSAGAQYDIALGESMTLTPRVDFSHTSGTWATLFQNETFGDRLPVRDLVNAQLTLATGPWSVAGYATNLTNQHYVAAINGFRRLAGLPRQYGIRVSRTF